MISLDEFLPRVRVEADGVPRALALLHIRTVLRELCRASHIWQQELDPITLYANVAERDIPRPDGAEVMRILGASYQGGTLKRRSTEQLRAADPDWQTATGDGLSAIVPGYRTVRLYPIPETTLADPLYLTVELVPSQSTTQCPDELLEYADGIAAGALARLKRMAGKPWTDRQAVREYEDEFNEAVGRAIHEVASGRTGASLQVKPREFGV